ncbi:hypothetical protein HDV64DRAFT_254843, partial [Trichoderma sp. TUCIM 5745]
SSRVCTTINHIGGSYRHESFWQRLLQTCPSQHSCNLSRLQGTMPKRSVMLLSSHCTEVTCPVPVLLTSHLLLKHGLSVGEVEEKGVDDEGEGGMD